MAADQRRKRLNGANIVGFSSREHYKTRKKKMDSPDNNLNPGAHINLEWDGSRKKVVAKRDQIGLSLRDLRPFFDSIPHRRNILADTCIVPQEIFDLENLTDVLSYEVWQIHFSEAERNFLIQFLPGGTDVEEVVEALLTGNNFHFGNLCLEWGSAVCSGNLHPDAVIVQEQRLKDDKRAYYSELQKYHYDIIDYLQKLKERWESCKDPEKEVLQKMWGSSRGDSTRADDSQQDLGQDLTAASESCSWNDADEKACSSDSKNSSLLKTGELKKRSRISETVENENYGNPSTVPDNFQNVGTKPRKKDKPSKHVQQTDGAKYMSYLKISKKQHQIVTRMKQSGKTIQSRSLNRILGNINKLDVQPYEVFVEEEQKKLLSHWLQMVKDLPAAYAIWKEIQLQKQEIIKSLERDLKDKLDPWVEDLRMQDTETILQKDDIDALASGSCSSDEDTIKETHKILIQNQNDVKAADSEPNMEDSGDSDQGSAQNQSSPLQVSVLHGGHEFELKDVEHDVDSDTGSPPLQSSPQASSPSGGHDVKLDNMEDKPGSGPSSPKKKPSPQVSSLISCHDFKPKDAEEIAYAVPRSLQDQSLSHVPSVTDDSTVKLNDTVSINKHSVFKLENAPVVMAKPSRNDNVTGIASSCGGPFSSGGDVWSAFRTGRSYIDSTSSDQAYTSTSGGLSLAYPQVNGEQMTSFIGLESNVNNEDGRKNMLQRQLNNGSFGLLTSQDRNAQLHSLFKNQGIPSGNQEHFQSLFDGQGMPSHNQGLAFQHPSDVSIEGDRFLSHFQELMQQLNPLHPTVQEHKRPNDIYMQDNTSGKIYCDGSRYVMPVPGGAQDWNIGNMRMAVPIQSRLNSGEILNQNWLSGEHQLQSVWSSSNGVGVPNQVGIQSDQSLNRESNSDQTLFSVLSQCNQLQSRRPLESVSSTEQLTTPRNYGMMMDGGMSRISSSVPQAAHPLEYLATGGNPTTTLMPDDVGWTSAPNQNSARHDPLRKLYPGSWNQ